MAINGVVHPPTARFGICEEATFGTAILDNTDWDGVAVTEGFMLECPVPTGIDYGIFQDHEIKNRGGRVAIDSDTFTTQVGQTRIIPVNDIIVRRKDMGHLLYGVCQNVSEAATTPYQKTYTLTGVAGSETTQPDFSASAGMFMSLGLYDPIASYHRKWTSCVIRNLTIKWDGAAGSDNRVRADAEFISGFTTTSTANFSGNWGFQTQNYIEFGTGHGAGARQLGGNDIVVYGFEVTINNGANRIGWNTTGNAETYAIPSYEVTGSVKTKYDANTQGAIAAFIAGTNQAVRLTVGSDGAAGYFDINLPTCKYTGATKEYGAEYGQAIDLPFKAFGTTAAAMATFSIADAVDRTW